MSWYFLAGYDYQLGFALQIGTRLDRFFIFILFSMGFLGKTATAFAVIATSIAMLSVYNYTAYEHLLADGDNLDCGFTQDFSDFLKSNGYSTYKFDRPDIKCGNFGGKLSATQKLKKIPVIFVHGNSDVAFGRGTADGYVAWQTGFRSLATYLVAQGWDKSQLYTTTWGPADPNQAQNNYHSKKNIMYMRAFVQAVLAYTKAKQIYVIGHSMGVSMGRRVIKGGDAKDHVDGTYNVGPSLSSKVKAFIGLAGANLGLTACYNAFTLPTCGKIDGFFPGALPSSGPSTFLNDLNTNGGLQGQNVYTIWSKFDDLIGLECLVWGKVTCRIPSQTAEVVKTTSQWGHFAVRDNTGPDLIKWIS